MDHETTKVFQKNSRKTDAVEHVPERVEKIQNSPESKGSIK